MPDPQFRLTCPAMARHHLRQFKTNTIGNDVTDGFVGETFRFVIPKDYPVGKPFPVEVTLILLKGNRRILKTRPVFFYFGSKNLRKKVD